MRTRFFLLRRFVLALAIFSLAALSFATEPYPVKVQRDVSIKMRDGVILRGDIFRPDADGQFPVLLERTPYRIFP